MIKYGINTELRLWESMVTREMIEVMDNNL